MIAQPLLSRPSMHHDGPSTCGNGAQVLRAVMDLSTLQAMYSNVNAAAVMAMDHNATLLRPVCHETSALFVANAGATVGLPPHAVAQLCEIDGIPAKVHVPDPHKTFMYVLFETEKLATEARTVLMNAERVGRLLTVKYADLHPKAAKSLLNAEETPQVHLTSEEAGIPGLSLYHDFLTEAEEHDILQSLGKEEWKDLAKRQVCHFGHAFEYMTRSVSIKGCNGPIPSYVGEMQRRIQDLPDVAKLDQLTVNKYPAGVGLSPHVDAHSAFTGAITSLSLSSGAVMEFRRGGVRKCVLLPRRSLVVMAHECRYACGVFHHFAVRLLLKPSYCERQLHRGAGCREHYIPHRKTDNINGEVVYRESYRISLTFRQARGFPCACNWPDMCDSQSSPLPPTRLLQLQHQGACPKPHPGNYRDLAASTGTAEGAVNSEQAQLGSCQFKTGLSCAATAAGVASERESLRNSAAQAVCEGTQSSGASSCDDAAVEVSAGTATCTGARDAGTQSKAAACHVQAAHENRNASCGHGEESQNAEQTSSKDDQQHLRELEVEHVHRVYEAIAPHFSATRFAVWPAVRAFMENLPTGAVVADIGCGNGKYFGVRQDIAVLASDRSAALVQVAQRRVLSPSPGQPQMTAADVFIADGMALPYRLGSCDAVLCIAVLHHISSPERRITFLKGLRDVLVVGGRALVTVWATEQEKPASTVDKWTPMAIRATAVDADKPLGSTNEAHETDQQAADYFVPWHLPFHRASAHLAAASGAGTCVKGAPDSETVQASVPEAATGEIDNQKKTVKFNRYYHLFAEEELRSLAESIEGVVVRQNFYDASNWVIDFERVS